MLMFQYVVDCGNLIFKHLFLLEYCFQFDMLICIQKQCICAFLVLYFFTVTCQQIDCHLLA